MLLAVGCSSVPPIKNIEIKRPPKINPVVTTERPKKKKPVVTKPKATLKPVAESMVICHMSHKDEGGCHPIGGGSFNKYECCRILK